jgi:hypothetical protein
MMHLVRQQLTHTPASANPLAQAQADETPSSAPHHTDQELQEGKGKATGPADAAAGAPAESGAGTGPSSSNAALRDKQREAELDLAAIQELSVKHPQQLLPEQQAMPLSSSPPKNAGSEANTDTEAGAFTDGHGGLRQGAEPGLLCTSQGTVQPGDQSASSRPLSLPDGEMLTTHGLDCAATSPQLQAGFASPSAPWSADLNSALPMCTGEPISAGSALTGIAQDVSQTLIPRQAAGTASNPPVSQSLRQEHQQQQQQRPVQHHGQHAGAMPPARQVGVCTLSPVAC